jgi:membrane-associated phospholipid phosphatase
MLRLLLLISVSGVLLAVGYGFFVRTVPGQALDNAGYFGRMPQERILTAYDGEILGMVRKNVIVIAAGVLLVFAAVRRRLLDGIVVLAAVALAIEGAEFLKHVLYRPQLVEPGGPMPAYFTGDTYPSGHTTVATSFALALVLLSPAGWRFAVAVLAGFLSASYATGVLFAGWHRPSDALGGIFWTLFCLGLAALLLVAFRRHASDPPSGGAARWMLPVIPGAAVALWLAMVFAGATPGVPGFVFIVMTGAILAASFAAPLWLVTALQGGDDGRSGSR